MPDRPEPPGLVDYCVRCGTQHHIPSDGTHDCRTTTWTPIEPCRCGQGGIYQITWPGGETVRYVACHRCRHE